MMRRAALAIAVLAAVSCGCERPPAKGESEEAPPEKAPSPSRRDADWPPAGRQVLFAWPSLRDAWESDGAVCRVVPSGAARYGRHFDMAPGNGAFFAERDGESAFDLSGALTVEMLITPAPDGGQVMEIGPFRLLQGGDELKLRVPSGDGLLEYRFGSLRPAAPSHLWMHLEPGRCAAWIDGAREPLRETLLGLRGEASAERARAIRFGGPWDGRLERVAVYSGLLDEDALRESRPPVESPRAPAAGRLDVEARLLEVTPPPDLAELRTYPGALVVNLYEAEPVGRIAVAHWAILDRRPVAGVPSEPGRVVELSIEPFEVHPQLKSRRLFNDISDFDAPLYYDIATPRLKPQSPP